MVDISAIAATLNSLKVASEMAQALIGIRDEQRFLDHAIEIGRKIVEANSHAAAAYATQTELTNRIGELERELVKLKDNAADLERYELKELHPGSFAYAIKPEVKGSDPVHYACTNCMSAGKKSILQGVERKFGIHDLRCPACGLEITRWIDSDWQPRD